MPNTASKAKTRIGVVMGSSSDWDTMQHAVQILQQFGIDHEAKVVSAHRMPDEMFTYAETALERGLLAIIAGAGGAARVAGRPEGYGQASGLQHGRCDLGGGALPA